MSEKELIFKHGDDYSVWKLRILGVLASKAGMYGLEMGYQDWKEVNSGVVKLEGKEDYILAQKRGLLILWRYLDGDIIRKLGNVMTVKDLFVNLDAIYQKKGGVELVLLMYKLVNLKMKNSDDGLEKYLGEFQGIVGEMERRGHIVVEVERAMFLLCGIPEEWATLRSQIFLKYEYEQLDTDKVKAALREHDSCLRLEKEKGEDKSGREGNLSEKALMARGKKCEKCGRWGHITKECNTKCFNCGKMGHVASRCQVKEGEKEEEVTTKTIKQMSAFAYGGWSMGEKAESKVERKVEENASSAFFFYLEGM